MVMFIDSLNEFFFIIITITLQELSSYYPHITDELCMFKVVNLLIISQLEGESDFDPGFLPLELIFLSLLDHPEEKYLHWH